MKPVLLVGLGNPLMGDEGIGWHLAQQLASDPRLPEGVDVLCGGTDLLRCAGDMEGRRCIVLIDAIQDGSESGHVTVFNDQFDEMPDRKQHAHHFSATEAMELLKIMVPARFTLLAVSIEGARMGMTLSASMALTVPALVERVLKELSCRVSCPPEAGAVPVA